MRLAPSLRRTAALVAAAVSSVSLSTPLLFAQGGMEEFEEVDPYTLGDKDKLAELGYEGLGTFLWAPGTLTDNVQETMGGLDVLFVETEHFKIASSLGSYRVPNDREEKAKLKEELKVMKKRMGKKFKPPKRDLDPWLRLHLMAQRSEAIYASFVEMFGLPDGGATGKGPYLGQKEKFKLLMTERKSELGRYLRAYEDGVNDYAFRSGDPAKGMFFGCNVEVIRESYDDPSTVPFDSILHNVIAEAITRNCVDGYDQNMFTAPEWFSTAIGFDFARQVDPRWMQTGVARTTEDDDHYVWEPRVKALVKNDFYAKLDEMFGWEPRRKWNERDFMVTWSKFRYMIDDLECDRALLLRDMVVPVKGMTANAKDELQKRQLTAFRNRFDLAPEEFDKRWAKAIKKRR